MIGSLGPAMLVRDADEPVRGRDGDSKDLIGSGSNGRREAEELFCIGSGGRDCHGIADPDRVLGPCREDSHSHRDWRDCRAFMVLSSKSFDLLSELGAARLATERQGFNVLSSESFDFLGGSGSKLGQRLSDAGKILDRGSLVCARAV